MDPAGPAGTDPPPSPGCRGPWPRPPVHLDRDRAAVRKKEPSHPFDPPCFLPRVYRSWSYVFFVLAPRGTGLPVPCFPFVAAYAIFLTDVISGAPLLCDAWWIMSALTPPKVVHVATVQEGRRNAGPNECRGPLEYF